MPNLNRVASQSYTPDNLKRIETYESTLEQGKNIQNIALTGRLTQANDESDGGTDQEFGIEELSSQHRVVTSQGRQADATFAPSNASRSARNTVKSSMDQQQRDILLLRCRDAIEELHVEIEDERNAKSAVEAQLRECQRLVQELQLRERDLRIEVEQLVQKNSTLSNELSSIETIREQKLQLEKELQLSKDSRHTLQTELTRAKEAFLKNETAKEVAGAKESQQRKDLDAYQR